VRGRLAKVLLCGERASPSRLRCCGGFELLGFALDASDVEQERLEGNVAEGDGIGEHDLEITLVRIVRWSGAVEDISAAAAELLPVFLQHRPALGLPVPDTVLEFFEKGFLSAGISSHVPADPVAIGLAVVRSRYVSVRDARLDLVGGGLLNAVEHMGSCHRQAQVAEPSVSQYASPGAVQVAAVGLRVVVGVLLGAKALVGGVAAFVVDAKGREVENRDAFFEELVEEECVVADADQRLQEFVDVVLGNGSRSSSSWRSLRRDVASGSASRKLDTRAARSGDASATR